MLVLTENATTVIRNLVDTPELPDGSGIRVASTADGAKQFTLSAASAPEADDAVVENDGARVFLDGQAAEVLDDKVLDAQVDDKGAVQFLVGTQT
jgi:iron-sulfur cluster assembly protein